MTAGEELVRYGASQQTALNSQCNPGRRRTPRQIAGDVIENLAQLTAAIPSLRCLGDEICTAYLLGKPMSLDPLRCGEWPEIEIAAQYAFDVRNALQAADLTAAWRAAAAATYWCATADARLRPEWVRQQAKEVSLQRIAAGRAKGAQGNRAQKDARRQRAIEIYRARTWSKDDAAEDIANQLRVKFTTARLYLRGVSTS